MLWGRLPGAAASQGYDRAAAAAFAVKYGKKPCPLYQVYSEDCTNFTSQCLLAGGWSPVGANPLDRHNGSKWFCINVVPGKTQIATDTWFNAGVFQNFLVGSGRGYLVTDLYDLMPGDLVQMRYPGSGAVTHTMIVSSVVGNRRFVSEHTDNNVNKPLDDIVATNPSVTFFAERVRDYYDVGRSVSYQAHVQNVGWMAAQRDGLIGGTTGRALRLEALTMRVSTGHIFYQAHVQNVGWMTPVWDGAVAGTTGRSLRLEAFRVWVSYGHVAYYAHVQDIGWMGPFHDGELAGTVGQAKRVEAVMVEVSD